MSRKKICIKLTLKNCNNPYSTNRQCQYFTPDIFGEKRTENVLSVIYAF